MTHDTSKRKLTSPPQIALNARPVCRRWLRHRDSECRYVYVRPFTSANVSLLQLVVVPPLRAIAPPNNARPQRFGIHAKHSFPLHRTRALPLES